MGVEGRDQERGASMNWRDQKRKDQEGVRRPLRLSEREGIDTDECVEADRRREGKAKPERNTTKRPLENKIMMTTALTRNKAQLFPTTR